MKKYTFFIIYFVIILFLSGCNKNNFNFSKLESAELGGDYGISLINSSYSIEELFNQMAENNFIFSDPDGNLFLKYEVDERNYLSDSSILSLKNAYKQFSWSYTHIANSRITIDTTFTLELESDRIIIKSSIIMHGILNIALSTSFSSITISSSNIKTADGNDFSTTFTQSSNNLSIDLTNYRYVNLSNINNSNILSIKVSTTLPASFPSGSFNINADFSVSNLRLKNFIGKVAKIEESISGLKDFTIFTGNKLSGDLTLYNTDIRLTLNNEFTSFTGVFFIDSLHCVENSFLQPMLEAYPCITNILGGKHDYHIFGVPNIRLSSDYSKLKYKFSVLVNPNGFDEGDLIINSNSKLAGSIDINFPFKTKISKLNYLDTLNFSLNSIELEKLIESAELRYGFLNKLPLTTSIQIYFYNSITGVVTDSVFTPSFSITGAYNNLSPSEFRGTVYLDEAKFHRIISADKIILKISVNTDNNIVFFNIKDYVKIKLGIKIKAVDEYTFKK